MASFVSDEEGLDDSGVGSDFEGRLPGVAAAKDFSFDVTDSLLATAGEEERQQGNAAASSLLAASINEAVGGQEEQPSFVLEDAPTFSGVIAKERTLLKKISQLDAELKRLQVANRQLAEQLAAANAKKETPVEVQPQIDDRISSLFLGASGGGDKRAVEAKQADFERYKAKCLASLADARRRAAAKMQAKMQLLRKLQETWPPADAAAAAPSESSTQERPVLLAKPPCLPAMPPPLPAMYQEKAGSEQAAGAAGWNFRPARGSLDLQAYSQQVSDTASGATCRIYPDGTRIWLYADGQVRQCYPDGQVYVLADAGNSLHLQPDGSYEWRWQREGICCRWCPAAKQFAYTWPTGQQQLHDSQGRLLQVRWPDGRKKQFK